MLHNYLDQAELIVYIIFLLFIIYYNIFSCLREHVQPQWVYDCVNNALLLSVKEYAPGKILPPHLSPFVVGSEEEHVPERQKELEKIKKKCEIFSTI